LDSALNVLARALENNKDNPEIWCHYLRLFSKRGTKEEVQEMCETAVEYAPDYQSFWTVSRKDNIVLWHVCVFMFVILWATLNIDYVPLMDHMLLSAYR
jgi:hypothetical protein